MAKYIDKYVVGNSDIVPFRMDETASERHERRKNAAASSQDTIKAWCLEHNVELVIANDGHHWQFRKGRSIVEWWPSSAKLVITKNGKKAYTFTTLNKP